MKMMARALFLGLFFSGSSTVFEAHAGAKRMAAGGTLIAGLLGAGYFGKKAYEAYRSLVMARAVLAQDPENNDLLAAKDVAAARFLQSLGGAGVATLASLAGLYWVRQEDAPKTPDVPPVSTVVLPVGGGNNPSQPAIVVASQPADAGRVSSAPALPKQPDIVKPHVASVSLAERVRAGEQQVRDLCARLDRLSHGVTNSNVLERIKEFERCEQEQQRLTREILPLCHQLDARYDDVPVWAPIGFAFEEARQGLQRCQVGQEWLAFRGEMQAVARRAQTAPVRDTKPVRDPQEEVELEQRRQKLFKRFNSLADTPVTGLTHAALDVLQQELDEVVALSSQPDMAYTTAGGASFYEASRAVATVNILAQRVQLICNETEQLIDSWQRELVAEVAIDDAERHFDGQYDTYKLPKGGAGTPYHRIKGRLQQLKGLVRAKHVKAGAAAVSVAATDGSGSVAIVEKAPEGAEQKEQNDSMAQSFKSLGDQIVSDRNRGLITSEEEDSFKEDELEQVWTLPSQLLSGFRERAERALEKAREVGNAQKIISEKVSACVQQVLEGGAVPSLKGFSEEIAKVRQNGYDFKARYEKDRIDFHSHMPAGQHMQLAPEVAGVAELVGQAWVVLTSVNNELDASQNKIFDLEKARRSTEPSKALAQLLFRSACVAGKFEEAQQLVARGLVDVNAVDAKGNTVFMELCSNTGRWPQAIQMLEVIPGINVDIANKDGKLPSYYPSVPRYARQHPDISSALCQAIEAQRATKPLPTEKTVSAMQVPLGGAGEPAASGAGNQEELKARVRAGEQEARDLYASIAALSYGCTDANLIERLGLLEGYRKEQERLTREVCPLCKQLDPSYDDAPVWAPLGSALEDARRILEGRAYQMRESNFRDLAGSIEMYEVRLRNGNISLEGVVDFVRDNRGYVEAHLAAGRITDSHERELSRRLDCLAKLAPSRPQLLSAQLIPGVQQSFFAKLDTRVSEFEAFWGGESLVRLRDNNTFNSARPLKRQIVSSRDRGEITSDEADRLLDRVSDLLGRAEAARRAVEEQKMQISTDAATHDVLSESSRADASAMQALPDGAGGRPGPGEKSLAVEQTSGAPEGPIEFFPEVSGKIGRSLGEVFGNIATGVDESDDLRYAVDIMPHSIERIKQAANTATPEAWEASGDYFFGRLIENSHYTQVWDRLGSGRILSSAEAAEAFLAIAKRVAEAGRFIVSEKNAKRFAALNEGREKLIVNSVEQL